jgi:hypothetical protein
LGAEVPTFQVALARPGVRVQLADRCSRRGRVFATSNKNKKINKFLKFLKPLLQCGRVFTTSNNKNKKNNFLKLLLIAEEVLETTQPFLTHTPFPPTPIMLQNSIVKI